MMGKPVALKLLNNNLQNMLSELSRSPFFIFYLLKEI